MDIALPHRGQSVAQTRSEAIQRGLNTFFTGEPCKNGHVSTRNVTDNRCRTCLSGSIQRNAKHEKNDIEVKRRLDKLLEPEPYLEVWEE